MSKHNASASAFGWDFQISSAIVLSIKNIYNIKKIKVEGKNEDIELELRNGKTIYAQTKSVYRYDDERNIISNLKKSLNNFNELYYKVNNIDKLIYITNSPNPLKDDKSIRLFSLNQEIKYDNLPKTSKKRIDELLKKDNISIDKSLLNIYVLSFYNETEDKYETINYNIRSFLDELEIDVPSKKLMELWKNIFFSNTTSKDIKIKRSNFIWYIIVLLLDGYSNDNMQNIDRGMMREVNEEYRKRIDYFSNDFKFISKILTDFQELKLYNDKLKDKVSYFVKEYWKFYINDIYGNLGGEYLDNEVKRYTIMSIIDKILFQRTSINKIKKRGLLDDEE